jgi:hypothetical protein
MASGRTVSASQLTILDQKVLEFCQIASNEIEARIPSEYRKIFGDEFGKIHYSRDALIGRGGGKLQRDALCTRGRSNKAPFSNRNLRWHPLIVSTEKPLFAKEIEYIEVQEDNILVFAVKDENDVIKLYPSDLVHTLPERYVATSKHWEPHVATLRNWNDVQWTQNSCVIPAMEACEWWDSVQTFLVLGVSVAVELYEGNFEKLMEGILDLLTLQQIDTSVKLPTDNFPLERDQYILCPLSKIPLSGNLEEFRKEPRAQTWQPNWQKSKKDEGEDSSIQLMHMNPLIETEIRHNVENVRYGFRWSNVAMTDHSLEETLDFMTHIVRKHGR